MKRIISPAFMILGFFFFGVGIYTSFEIYATQKQKKINANFASVILSVFKGEELKELDYPDQGFFILTSSGGKRHIIGDLQNPSAYSPYIRRDLSNAELAVYLRGYNFGEFLEELIKNPASLGISLSGIILFLTGVFYTLSQRVPERIKEVKEEPYPDLKNRLKALRLTLATHEIIPKESNEEAKRILDDILKEMEGIK